MLPHQKSGTSTPKQGVLRHRTPSAPPLILTPASALQRLEKPEKAERINPSNAASKEGTAYWSRGSCLRWNEIARECVYNAQEQAPAASRTCALVSVAQYDAATLAKLAASSPSSITTQVAVACASAETLAFLYREQKKNIQNWLDQHTSSLLLSADTDAVQTAMRFGKIAASYTIAHAREDGCDKPWHGRIPTGPGFWSGTRPVCPQWGTLQNWTIGDADNIAPPPPPKFNSPQFKSELAAVIEVTKQRTFEQARIAYRWGDGSGTFTPPGRWNAIASDYLFEKRSSEEEAVKVLCCLNLGLFDAGVQCWKTKYQYWFIRPSQASKQVDAIMTVPRFPSYVSGHATFSSCAAAILSECFKEKGKAVDAMAQEASLSRFYAGIHYRFDCDEGMKMGRAIGKLCAARFAKFTG